MLAEYQRQLTDQVEQSLYALEKLDWYKQLPHNDQVHLREILFTTGELRLDDNLLPPTGTDPTDRLFVTMAVLLTAYELQLTQITEHLLSSDMSRQLEALSNAQNPGRRIYLPGRDFG